MHQKLQRVIHTTLYNASLAALIEDSWDKGLHLGYAINFRTFRFLALKNIDILMLVGSTR